MVDPAAGPLPGSLDKPGARRPGAEGQVGASLGSALCGIVVGMGFLDKLLGRDDRAQHPPQQQWAPPAPGQFPVGDPGWTGRHGQPVASEDERALARYRYLLRTAPPEQVEEVHAEAFAKLTPEQRQQVVTQLTNDLPPGEAPGSDDPRAMARAATRAEMQQPGYMQRSFGGGAGRGGPGMGSMFAGSMLGSIAGVVVGSMVAQSLLGGFDQSPEAGEVGEGGEAAEGADGGQEAGGEDAGGEDAGGGDVGAGEAGGDFGGGDFGGGDFGGGFGDF